MEIKKKSLVRKYNTVKQLTHLLNVTIADIFNYACEGQIQLGILSDAWALQTISKEQALFFDYTQVKYDGPELPGAFKDVLGKELKLGSKEAYVQIPFAFMLEDLIRLKENNNVVISFVKHFDQEKYFLIHRRHTYDTRYRQDLDDPRLFLSIHDISNLIITSEEKEQFENTYFNNPTNFLINEKNLQDHNTSKKDEPKSCPIQFCLGLLTIVYPRMLGHAYLHRGKPKQIEIFNNMIGYYKKFGSKLSFTGIDEKTVTKRFRSSFKVYQGLKNNFSIEFLNNRSQISDDGISQATQSLYTNLAFLCRAYSFERKFGDWDKPDHKKIAKEMFLCHTQEAHSPNIALCNEEEDILTNLTLMLEDADKIIIQTSK